MGSSDSNSISAPPLGSDAEPTSPKSNGSIASGTDLAFGGPITSTGNSLVDFFAGVDPTTPTSIITDLLAAAWRCDPLTALKLICHLRAVRGVGKSDRRGFYAAALWLHNQHPQTLALNLPSFASFGYLKDLLEILHRLIAGAPDDDSPCLRRPSRQNKKPETSRNKAEMAAQAREKYERDGRYKFLHDRIADLFAGMLKSDLEMMNSGRIEEIGLAAKWCPSLDSAYDRSTLICESIARRLFPRESHPDYADLEEKHYGYRIRDRLRREVLVPLRKALELPEVYVSAGEWSSVPYARVGAAAMKQHKDAFFKHDGERFMGFLAEVRDGNEKIAAGGLLPHEILAPIFRGEDGDEVVELQWRRMVSDLAGTGRFRDCLAVCLFSGNASAAENGACLALGLLISELSEEPWKGRLITAVGSPKIQKIEGESIREKARFLQSIRGHASDFHQVFDTILRVAAAAALPPEKMIKKVFCFNNKNISWTGSSWEEEYEKICMKFGESGYGEVVPQIVFWDVKSLSWKSPEAAAQVAEGGKKKGVAVVSGFSKNMVRLFLAGEVEMTPERVMEVAISGEEYDKLVVFD